MKEGLGVHARTNKDNVIYCVDFVTDMLPNVTVLYGLIPKGEYGGTYIIHDDNWNVLYIGESSDIRKRLKSKKHPMNKLEGFKLTRDNSVCLIYVDEKERYRAETMLIGALAPYHNRVKYLHGKTMKR